MENNKKGSKIIVATFILSLLTFIMMCIFTYKAIQFENKVNNLEKQFNVEKQNIKDKLSPSKYLKDIFK